jgi:hypothetical protein
LPLPMGIEPRDYSYFLNGLSAPAMQSSRFLRRFIVVVDWPDFRDPAKYCFTRKVTLACPSAPDV